eukprot:1998695-Amphidinium_carterae.1
MVSTYGFCECSCCCCCCCRRRLIVVTWRSLPGKLHFPSLRVAKHVKYDQMAHVHPAKKVTAS